MAGEARMARVWSRIGDCARADGRPVSVAHACIACAGDVGAAGAGLSMSRGSTLREPVFATDARSGELGDLQFTLGEGPCMDAMTRNETVLAADLASAGSKRRWPVFAPAAVALGVRGVFSIPIGAGAAQFGALDLYRDGPGLLSHGQLLDVLAYADALLVLMLDHRGGISPSLGRFLDEEFTERRAGVHQAAGMVSVQLRVKVADALARLRAYAYAQDRRLIEVSAAVVARRLRFDPDTGEGIEDVDGAQPRDGRPSETDVTGKEEAE
ncbi:ANTAR domain-containing protein [Nonomuraea sp. NPDC050536]|uniref:ANTAR domain-containing protein n=1 Tax=Nonomuraea sp. NPDC050536 TaxID=3364366 RepID=UPI0037CC67CA